MECNENDSNTINVENSAVTSRNITKSPSAVSPASNPANKNLPNIQPKVNTNGISATRQIIPKIDNQNQPGASATPANNIIIPQGIQHVLINGQLYPIIQTANGTHLLIQQPVGQIQQNGGKQVFTAQPIQLNNSPLQIQTQSTAQPSLGSVTSSEARPVTGATVLTNASNTLQNNAVPASSNIANKNSFQTTPISVPSSQPSTSLASGSIGQAPAAAVPAQQQPAQIYLPNQHNVQIPVTVSPHTQQVLSKIQAQIEVLKPKAEQDVNARNSLMQLQNIQQQIINELRNQMQAAQQRQQAGNQPPPTPLVHPVKEGENPMTSSNVMALMAAFVNVKWNNQVYNIQLTEDQKKFMIERMVKMTAEQQFQFLRQQQIQILSTAVIRPPPTTAPSTPSMNTNQSKDSLSSTNQSGDSSQQAASPKPGNRSRARRPKPKGLSTNTSPVDSPQQQIIDLSEDSSQSSSKAKATPSKPKSRYSNFSSKKIGERMLAQIQKDQEALLKAGAHKKPFANKNQLIERLLRYHIYYTDDRMQHARKLQETELFASIAHKMVLRREDLTERFRKYLWKQSLNPHQSGERILIAELLLEDEKEALEKDKKLESEDIELFKRWYTKPEREPTPPPKSPTPPPPRLPLTNMEEQVSEPLPEIHVSPDASEPQAKVKRQTKAAKKKASKNSLNKSKTESKARLAEKRRGRQPKLKEAVVEHEMDIFNDSSFQEMPEPSNNEPVPSTSENQSLVSDDENDEISIADDIGALAKKYSNEATDIPVNKASPASNISERNPSFSESETEDIDIDDASDSPPAIRIDNFHFNRPPQFHHTNPSWNENLTSSPVKQNFSICSETVVAQSEQVDHSFERLNSADDSLTNGFNQSYQDIQNQYAYQTKYHLHQAEQEESCSQGASRYSEADDETDVEGYSMKSDRDVGDQYTQEEYDEEEDVDVDNDDEEPDMDGEEEENQVPFGKPFIAPLRINKRQLENYSSEQEDESNDTRPPPIKLKIQVTEAAAPQPIKLKIKRDQYDTWEALSNVSSNMSERSTDDEADDPSEDDSSSDIGEPVNGGVPVNWDDENGSTIDEGNSDEVSDASEQEDDYEQERSPGSYRAGIQIKPLRYEIDEDSVPFVNYSNYNQEEYDSS